MKKIDLVVFDMAGTTIDEDNVVYKTVLKAIQNKGNQLDLEYVLLYGAGQEKKKAIATILEELLEQTPSEILVQEIFEDFKGLLTKAYQDLEVKPCHGIPLFLEQLRLLNIKIALNTGYDRKTALGLLQKLGWKEGNEYDVLVTADDVSRNRPHPDMILNAMKQLHITDASTVMKVGDSGIDILEGKNASCGITVGVTTGAQTHAQLQEFDPDFIVDNINDLKKYM